ncbi:M20/M25/M40 family metallo-hydrolase [Stieleria varia]|uniref:Carboxypeptidase G2 n=1 Tax=Stieleria varia TaxID=2528005 RepID=A0A5C6AWD0_9BACT|nr:M20/M25/M40 family metallo-hydrolase [Stieleria varia]TWU02434.1 Carboxypeptidase G2 precursor [Stieleria varia]
MSEIEVNKTAALERFLSLTAIRGGSGDEKAVAEAIAGLLIAGDCDPSWIQTDDANTRTKLKGNTGNLIVKLPGRGSGPITMLSAHMDTVPICLGSQPEVRGDEVHSSAPTGLGADDRSGCAAILTAALERLAVGEEQFAPAVIVFIIQEEIGLHGARHLSTEMVGTVDRAFNFDGGSLDKVTTGAIGGERMDIRLSGIPAHAGVAPENGASAIVMAARAIESLDRRGWLGKVENEFGVGTANVGVIHGGDATNVVTPEVSLRAEARSHDSEMRTRIVGEIRSAFETAAAEVTNAAGHSGTCEFQSQVDYEAFALPEDHPSIQAAEKALLRIGRSPYRAIANGGLDANWLFRHGIAAVTMGCGQKNIHTADERLELPDFYGACQVATHLITE